MTKRTLLISIPAVAILLNGVGYLIVSKVRAPSPAVEPPGANGRSQVSAGTEATPQAPNPKSPAPGSTNGGGAVDLGSPEEQAQARRAAGLAALEAGNYDKALINFTEAKAMAGDKANVADLLRVTEELRNRPPGPSRLRGSGSTPEPAPHRISSRAPARRLALREEPADEAAPTPASSEPSGLLIVTSTPRGMLVHLDDAPLDLTPMKVKVKAGSHRVALLDGDRRVYETTVDVKEGATATIVRDLPADRTTDGSRAAGVLAPGQLAGEANRPSTSTPPPTAPLAAVPAVAAAPSAAQQAGAAPLSTSAQDLGGLDIASPGLYEVVWINGRPRGYPPLAVRDLPAGPVQVEVRVNGVQKRAAIANVRAGSTTAVTLRSSTSN